MKKTILVLILTWMVGVLPVYALDMGEQGVAPYPYPPVLSQPVANLPQGFDTIILGNEAFYYSNGIFYQKIVRDDAYITVPPPIGAVVRSLPSGYQYIFVSEGKALYVSGGVYYKNVLDGYKVTYPPSGT